MKINYRDAYRQAHGPGPYICARCKDVIPLGAQHIHHVDEDRSNNTIENLVAMHPRCHKNHHDIWRGRKHSEEARRKMSEAAARHTGGVIAPETRAKISATLAGHEVSDVTRAKISAANRGRTLSDEARARISAGAKAMWARKREGA